MKNKVALIAKGYAVVNAIVGIIIATLLGNSVSIYVAAGSIVLSFLFYCVGEGLQLLQDIKDTINSKNEAVKGFKDELPVI